MTANRSDSDRGRLVIAVVVTVIVTALVAVAVVAAVFAGSGRAGDPPVGVDDSAAPAATCEVPDLPGTVVAVFLTDMGLEADGQHSRMTSGTAMFLSAEPTEVAEGTVSFLAINGGRLTHELVIMPLSGSADAGARLIGDDQMVSEEGSLGEASTSCGEGPGQGIAPDASSWVTLTLPVGRYELISNLPGQYSAGMHAEFTVTATAPSD